MEVHVLVMAPKELTGRSYSQLYVGTITMGVGSVSFSLGRGQ